MLPLHVRAMQICARELLLCTWAAEICPQSFEICLQDEIAGGIGPRYRARRRNVAVGLVPGSALCPTSNARSPRTMAYSRPHNSEKSIDYGMPRYADLI
jgi:hypothetical protein